MARVGYARVSTREQSLDIQLEKLQRCDKVFSEKKSGTSTKNREAFKLCLNYLREGDQLIVTRLDRLARSVNDLSKLTEMFQKEGIDLVVLDQCIDTSTSTGKLLFHMLGAIAEFENDLRKERQIEGIEKAQRKGIRFGAKDKLTQEQLKQLWQDKEAGEGTEQLCKKYNLSKSSIFRLLAQMRQDLCNQNNPL